MLSLFRPRSAVWRHKEPNLAGTSQTYILFSLCMYLQPRRVACGSHPHFGAHAFPSRLLFIDEDGARALPAEVRTVCIKYALCCGVGQTHENENKSGSGAPIERASLARAFCPMDTPHVDHVRPRAVCAASIPFSDGNITSNCCACDARVHGTPENAQTISIPLHRHSRYDFTDYWNKSCGGVRVHLDAYRLVDWVRNCVRLQRPHRAGVVGHEFNGRVVAWSSAVNAAAARLNVVGYDFSWCTTLTYSTQHARTTHDATRDNH